MTESLKINETLNAKIGKISSKRRINAGSEALIYEDPESETHIYKIFKKVIALDPKSRQYDIHPLNLDTTSMKNMDRRVRMMFMRDYLVLSILTIVEPKMFPEVSEFFSKRFGFYKRPRVSSRENPSFLEPLFQKIKFFARGVHIDMVGEGNFLKDSQGNTVYVDGVELANRKRFHAYVARFLETCNEPFKVKTLTRYLALIDSLNEKLREK